MVPTTSQPAKPLLYEYINYTIYAEKPLFKHSVTKGVQFLSRKNMDQIKGIICKTILLTIALHQVPLNICIQSRLFL